MHRNNNNGHRGHQSKDPVSIARRSSNKPSAASPATSTATPLAAAAPAPLAARSEPPSERESVYRDAKRCDEQLKALAAAGKGPLDREVQQVRNKLRQHYEAVRLCLLLLLWISVF
jgi:hypothetical protein